MYVAGGTDLLPNMKRRQFEPAVLVGLRGIAELRGSRGTGPGGLELGAGITLREVARSHRMAGEYTALQEAAAQVANLQIQRAGTLGGNLCVDTRCNYYNQTEEWRAAIGYCMKRDGDICLVAPGSSKCWAVSSSDAAPMLMALRARVVLVGPDGDREIPLGALYRDDGIRYLARRPDEILARILVPVGNRRRSTYRKVRRRGSFDFPILGVAAALELHDGAVRHARLVLGAVHTHPVEVDIADLIEGAEPTDERIDAVAEAAFRAATPLDNADLMYHWRKKVVRVEVRRAFRNLLQAD